MGKLSTMILLLLFILHTITASSSINSFFTLRHEYCIHPLSKTPSRADLLSQDSPSVLLQQFIKPHVRSSPALSQWTSQLQSLPDITHKHTVVELARMAGDAYIPEKGMPDWSSVGERWNNSHHFGWEEDGLRGHVFVDHTNSTVVIALKGTSAALFGSGKTSARDKVNVGSPCSIWLTQDNLFFSCCCAHISYAWKTVCDCYSSSYSCTQSCLENQLQSRDSYYKDALLMYDNISSIYPTATIWVVGHSLGGAIASLLGLTFGLPTVTFQAPGELLAAHRLHLPLPPAIPPSEANVWHFGHTADPVFMGVCTGPSSSCWYAGYAMETHCHTGLECVYDTVADKGWRVDIRTHSIFSVINDVLLAYDDVPTCTEVKDCIDCGAWTFKD